MTDHVGANRAQVAWHALIRSPDLATEATVLAVVAASRSLQHDVRAQRDHLLRMRRQGVPETGVWATDRLARVARGFASARARS